MPANAQYAYGVGRIRVIEKKLIDKAKFDRMIDAKTTEEALRVLNEAGYGESAPGERDNPHAYEKLIKEEQKKLCKLIKELTEGSEAVDIFLLRNDYNNIKVLLKSEFLGEEKGFGLLDTGTIPAAKLKEIIRDRNFEELPLHMKNAIEEAIDMFNRTQDPRQIDLISDRAYFRHASELAWNSGIDFIIKFFEITIDLLNIKTFLRMKKLGMTYDLLQNSFIAGGKINKKIFTENFDLPLESFAESMKGYIYEDICRKGIENLVNTGSLAIFEKLADNYMISFARKAKSIVLGIEPLIAYFLAKENEFKNVRIIMVGKVNNIPSNIIRERLRDTYA